MSKENPGGGAFQERAAQRQHDEATINKTKITKCIVETKIYKTHIVDEC